MIIDWYHPSLRHLGVTRTLNSLSQTFKWKGMCGQIENHIKTCDACQHHKITGKGHYGQMPLVSSLREEDPFTKVYVDCAGLWTVRVKNDVTQELCDYKIHILTMVDVAKNWPELVLVPSAISCCCTKIFDLCWLCCYPRPNTVGHDNINEFMGEEFQELLSSYGIKSCPTTVKNPTAQAVIERLHLTIGDQLRTSLYQGDNWEEDVEALIQACTWAIRTTTPSNSPFTPSQLTFGMDMIFRQKAKIDWALIKKQRHERSEANNKKENHGRCEHTYKVGDLLLIVEKPYERMRKGKLSSPTEGPYKILQVYVNG
ncbi:hypothetical protein ACHAW6_000485, partial [Cyclotella cf. meneghiniana]